MPFPRRLLAGLRDRLHDRPFAGLQDRYADRARLDVGLVRPALAAGAAALLVASLVLQRTIRRHEACASARLLHLVSPLDAGCRGTSVVFHAHGHLAGYALDLGCSAALLTLPFIALTALLLVIRRASVVFALLGLALTVATIFAVNQLRLLLIGIGMGLWGAEAGYARTHLLVGAVVSTLGLIVAGRVYLAVVVRGTDGLAVGARRG